MTVYLMSSKKEWRKDVWLFGLSELGSNLLLTFSRLDHLKLRTSNRIWKWNRILYQQFYIQTSHSVFSSSHNDQRNFSYISDDFVWGTYSRIETESPTLKDVRSIDLTTAGFSISDKQHCIFSIPYRLYKFFETRKIHFLVENDSLNLRPRWRVIL